MRMKRRQIAKESWQSHAELMFLRSLDLQA
jgi:hypothetical protein